MTSFAVAHRLLGRGRALPPISGYAPHPDRSAWIVVLVIAAVVYLALTLPRG